ncbi:DUF4942 domain-containing protein [Riemerella anatipestifer]|nr:DUF4942 domain-containing protein [Riemerella anatipestifer]MBT0573679.1 DUF4942 domain-containing protein [Riemerella anatipestifer]QZO86428.1 DUF4942 domain-containing protein [Riemerella anatipestifer]QZO95017.1 DUF4942 domain-containing protein [Riemerella anatipestifer]
MKYQNLFNQDFYPTPREVLDLMELDVNNKIILEPSAGKGNIIDYLKEYGAKEVLFCEINKDLAEICKNKANQIGTDFLELKPEAVAGVEAIIMNPPFSEFRKHFLHAWNIAPDGCEIVSLCNYDSVSDRGSFLREKEEILNIIEAYGYKSDLGNVFSNAERQTDVSIGLIKVYKPITSESLNFDDYFDNTGGFDIDSSEEGIIRYSEIDSLVNSYKGIAKYSEKLFEDAELFMQMAKSCGVGVSIKIGVELKENKINRQLFLREVQVQLWHKVFKLFNIEKYVTSSVAKDLEAWVRYKSQTPFTKRNIFKMIEIIYGTKDHNFKRSLVEAIDNYTRHTKENRYSVEGWATNSGHLLNRKFIVPNMCKVRWCKNNHLRVDSSGYMENFNDLLKVLCSLEGKNYDKIERLNAWEEFERGIWHDMEFFRYKGFKKGTMHFEFKDKNVWERLNRAYAQAKGNVLPEKL